MKIKNLASAVIGKLTGGTFFPITDGTTTYKVDYNLLAQAILENATRSTLTTTSKTAVGAINETAQAASANTAGRIGMLSNVNLDDLHTDADCGVYWLNFASSTGITGTKPIDAGQGVFIVKRMTSALYKQLYMSTPDNDRIISTRYYSTNTGVWTDWAEVWVSKSIKNSVHLASGSSFAGTALASDTDINQLLTGEYYWPNSTYRPSANIPDNTAFRGRLWALDSGGNNDSFVQICYTSNFNWFIRYCTSKSSYTWGAWERINAGETEYTSLACAYGTLTYKCYKTGRIVSLIATIDVTSDIPKSSDFITGLPYTGQTSNYTPIRAFNDTTKTYIDLDLHRVSTSSCAMLSRTAIASGASIHINATYVTE